MRAGSWFPLWFGITCGLLSIAWYTPGEDALASLSQRTIVTTLMVLHLAIISWTLGYLTGPGRSGYRTGNRLANLVTPTGAFTVQASAPWLLFGLSLAGRAISLLSGRLGYVGDPSTLLTNPARSGQATSALIQCGNLALVVAAVAVMKQPTVRNRVTLAVLMAAQILLGGLAGGKQSFIVAVLALAIVLGARGRFPWKTMAASAAVFLLFFAPFVYSYRTQVRGADYTLTTSQAFARVPATVQEVATVPAWERVKTTVGLLAERDRSAESVALVVGTSPHTYPYRPITQYLWAPIISIVPRAIWPSKPVLSSGADFARLHFGFGSNVHTSAAVPPTADLYWHGGPVPVAIGMFLIGMFTRLADRTLHPRRDPRLAILFLPLFVLLVKSEADVTYMVASIPVTLITSLIAARLAFRPAPAAATSPTDAARVRPGLRRKTPLTRATRAAS
jgi:hypothetical protein